MATSRTRRDSMEKLRLTTENDEQGSTYSCDCGQDFFDENYFRQHQQTNCKNRQIQCSFCQEKFASNDTLKAHLLSCGNKTEQCPNCRQLIRRSHFAYHYENHCAPVDQVETPPRLPKNPENRRPQVNPNLPVARTDVPPTFNSAKITECEYCYEKCSTDDLLAHTKNCPRNPGNLTSSRENLLRQTKSHGVAHVPCEICNALIDIPNWAKHTQECRAKDKKRAEERARAMSKEGLTEKLPCETCNQLIPADKLNQHQLNCGSNRTGAEYATIDHDRTRNANQADDDQNTKSKKSSKHNLRHGHDRMEIIDNEEGQMIQKKKKPSFWKRFCCGATPKTVDE